MRKTLEILRLAHECQWSIRQIAESVGAPRSTVADYLSRFKATGLPWPLPAELGEAELEARLFARTSSKAVLRPLPDWPSVHRELQRKGITLDLLWQEYKREHPDGYQYTRFCHLYHAWAQAIDPVLRQAHPTGEQALGLAVWTEDEAGPFQTIPVAGQRWCPEAKPVRYLHEHIRDGTAKLLTLFHPASGEVHVKGVPSCTNVVLHGWLESQLDAVLTTLPGACHPATAGEPAALDAVASGTR